MSLEDAVIGLKAFKEVDQRMGRLWDGINKAVLLPRMDITKDTIPRIHTQDVSVMHNCFLGDLLTSQNRTPWNLEAQQIKPPTLCSQTSKGSSHF